MLAYFEEELKLLKPGDKSQVISYYIIELLFGYYNSRMSPDKQTGITGSALVILLRTVFDSHECKLDGKLMNFFTSETVNSVGQ